MGPEAMHTLNDLSSPGAQTDILLILILSGIQEKPAPDMADAWLSCLFAYLSTRYRRLREEGHHVTRPKSAKRAEMQAKQPGRN
ncbi:hypothetical protein ANCCAN_10645 [Ancylostoma caninum]|uniref:Uncharacterized protein n=1 Tax=Ancylostoma caninum TaxID=29170 RepID=A0A368GK16_ANCCA|nr:hypothetical protein ANCCAN_10645 [Ancylostoma caninum]